MEHVNELPIFDVLSQVMAALDRNQSVILRAPPGAGKTTVIPLAILEQQQRNQKSGAGNRKIIITQPRRLAARTTAARISQLNRSELGSTVGYQIRMQRRWNESTRIIAMTTGVLLRRMLNDPFLEDFEFVILDEFHERSLELDLALGMLTRLQQTVRPDLKIIIMSATMECGPIADFLEGAPVIESPGRCFEVTVRYVQSSAREKIETSVASLLPAALSATAGHLLVFLPGVGEIARTHQAIEPIAKRNGVQVFRLFGDMSPADQDLVLAPSDQRKIILATNVAETSLTIDGVTGVIDSGLVRTMRYHSAVGLSRLVLESTSLASAEQRAGRAGRQAPGVCFRLWPESMNRIRSDFDTPEVHRADLSGAILQLAGMGEIDCAAFPWLTPPKPKAVETAKALLTRLGALRDDRITSEGQLLLRVPVAPRLAKLMIASQRLGVAERGALAAALLSEKDILRTGHSAGFSGKPSPACSTSADSRSDSDLVDRAIRVEHALSVGYDPEVGQSAVRAIERSAKDLLRSMANVISDDETIQSKVAMPGAKNSPANNHLGDRDTRLRRAIGEAYPDRVARRRCYNSDRALMVGGVGVKLAPYSSVKNAEWFVCVDVEQRDGDSVVRIASAIDPQWLPTEHQKQVTEYFFNPTTGTVQARKRTYWLDLMIEDHPVPLQDKEQVALVLWEEVTKRWDSVFPADDVTISNLLARLRWLRQLFPNDGWPECSTEEMQQIALQLCQGKQRLDEVRKGAWHDFLWNQLTYECRSRLNELAPVEWVAPSGNRIKIDYDSPTQPRISVRMQELFGLAETPRLFGGRIACLLELLGPNDRPQQLTSDLASFWQNTYPTVRKELLRRYPKHHWPEDPRTSSATRSGLKRDVK
jgi:ATP-dependent helicase HrpB